MMMLAAMSATYQNHCDGVIVRYDLVQLKTFQTNAYQDQTSFSNALRNNDRTIAPHTLLQHGVGQQRR
jgi:hypothetical protein